MYIGLNIITNYNKSEILHTFNFLFLRTMMYELYRYIILRVYLYLIIQCLSMGISYLVPTQLLLDLLLL